MCNFEFFLLLFKEFGQLSNTVAQFLHVSDILILADSAFQSSLQRLTDLVHTLRLVVENKLAVSLAPALLFDLTSNLQHHLVCCLSNRFHSHGEEPVRNHSPENKPCKLPRSNKLQLIDSNSISESTEEGKGDQCSRSDCKSFSNSSSRVTSSVQFVRVLAYVLWHARHLSNSTSIVGDRPISINGQPSSQGHQDTKSSACNTEHTTEGVSKEHGNAQADDRDDSRLVTQSETVNDVCSRARFTRFCKSLCWTVGERGIVFGDKSDNQTAP
mmetsp:Transcript_14380/g.17247  ORF Transcript_14380/g.17247 Transcript_14380/m.17247 type:complete len:271 (-) Transcript_14380:161-973(-)